MTPRTIEASSPGAQSRMPRLAPTLLRVTLEPDRQRARRGLGVFRLALAAVELVAIVANYEYVLGFPLFATSNFFSYFTILSAIIAVIVLALAGALALTRTHDPPWLGVVRTAVTVYVLVSGVVFAGIAMQASTRDTRVDVPWSDVLLHFVVPTLAVIAWSVDAWLAVNPPVPWSTVGWVLVFPSGWLVYTLLRGAAVGWYPYFFLDPVQVGGLGEAAMYCVVVLLIFLSLTALLVAVNRRLHRRAHRVRATAAPRRGTRRRRVRRVVPPAPQ